MNNFMRSMFCVFYTSQHPVILNIIQTDLNSLRCLFVVPWVSYGELDSFAFTLVVLNSFFPNIFGRPSGLF